MKGFRNRLMIVIILIIIGAIAPHLGAKEKFTPAQMLLSEAIAYGHCNILADQLKANDPVFIAYWMGFAERYSLNLEILKAGCAVAKENIEHHHKMMGEPDIVSRETF